MKNFKLPKWVVVVVAAAVFLPLAVDWVAPGAGARIAVDWLDALREAKVGGAIGRSEIAEGLREQVMLFPLWGWLVGLAGCDVAALGWISVGAGILCVWLVAAIFGEIFGAAVRGAKAGGVKGEENYRFVESAVVLLAGLGFAFTPGFLSAATRISPLMVALAPLLAAVALAVRPKKWRLLLAAGLVGYSAFELVLARRVFGLLAFPAVWAWLAVGVMPALVIAWCVRRRWIVGRKAIWGAFGGWTLAVAVMAVVAFTSGWLNAGRSASRLVARIIVNAEESGKVAVVSDGGMDALFFFMLPEKIKLISLARERDPKYGRELSEWVRKEVKMEGEGEQGNVEDLAFAAELGPRALIDEWVKVDQSGFESAVATVANFFPTREKWDEACAELDGMRADEPMAGYLRHLLGVTGNALGCKMIEEKNEREAWAIFVKIVDTVEPRNYGAYLNLLGMVQRGYAVPKDEVDDLAKRRQQLEKGLKSWEQILGAARSSGRLYADPEDVAKYEKAKQEAAERRELSLEANAFVETVAAAPKDPKRGKAAQEAIHRAIREGKVRIDRIGGRLVTIDLALGDMENAEKDAIDILKLDRHEPTANAALGALAGSRGDYERAERYLRRAIATGKASIAAKNDLAWTLYRQGRLDEAETFAREAVEAYGEAWAMRETLAAILIRQGKTEEGERELAKAEELAEKAGVPKGKIVSIEIDRARLLKAKGDTNHFKVAIRQLKSRKNLTDEQKTEIEGVDW